MVTKLTIKIHTDSHFPDFYWTHPKFKVTCHYISLPREQKIHTNRSGKSIPSGLLFHRSSI